jgi:ubiquinone/menaquinone biosynthesis C-methylase UbiE
MTARLRTTQIAAWMITAAFLAGFFYQPIGAWTGAVLGVWFVGTQKPLRGFLWMFGIALVPSLIGHARALAGEGSSAFLDIRWLVLGAAVSVLSFLLHRLITGRMPGFAATLAFPICSVCFLWAAAAVVQTLPAGPTPAFAPAWMQQAGWSAMAFLFVRMWFASSLIWAWNREFHFRRMGPGVDLHARSRQDETLALLRSPASGEPVCFDDDTLVTDSGERFPVRNGIVEFLSPLDLAGQNGKYNRLYETIGGFYDDSQRVVFALGGLGRDTYVRSYMDLLEIKPGDAVLETSVGTGLNFKYLPRDIRRFGLDLSAAMLAAAQQNFSRWNMDAELFLGNAEALPFVDNAFDVVFHVGGINFFSDRAAAIREMIRVAKPGSLLLIADETEEHVKAAYESIPYTREFFKDRADAVSAPVDLLPPEMEEVRLNILNVSGRNRFYALTFRKPLVPFANIDSPSLACCAGSR